MLELNELVKPNVSSIIFDATAELEIAQTNKKDGYEPVLLLEDDEYDAATTIELLEKFTSRPFKVTRVQYLKDAIALVKAFDFKIALLDMGLPDSSGLMAVRKIVQSNNRTPIVVLTGTEDSELALDAMRMGAQDFLPKSQLNNKALERVVVHSIHRKAMEGESKTLAYADMLTGTVNRTQLHERWARMAERSENAQCKIGVLSVDLVNFDAINIQSGHDAGDALLVHIAKELKSTLYKTDMVSRLGDDDFVAVLENIKSIDDLLEIKNRIKCILADSFVFKTKNISYSVRVGCTLSDPKDKEQLVAAIKRADDDMYQNDPKFHAAM